MAVTDTPKTGYENPMKSTWRSANRATWGHNHWANEMLNLHPTDLNRPIPKHAKDQKMPYMPSWQAHKWVLIHAAWPVLLHQLFVKVAGRSMHPAGAFLLYMVAFKINAIRELQTIKNLGHRYGFLDGDKHDRDQIPDKDVDSVFHSLVSTVTVRVTACVFLAYRRSQTPAMTNWWWLPVEIGVYQIVLDFWFYWYHRVMHESETLWQFHRKHHMTKHPTPLLTLYADHIQEIFDIAVVPLMTYGTMKLMGLPMDFVAWWFCHQYIVFTELWGHSGLRVRVTPPTTAPLRLIGCELTTEDHDLHHRRGWKTAGNYGKQTLLWDTIFGTTLPRVEMMEENVDWNSPVPMPLF